MKYQALKHLKTKAKVLKICDTIDEAKAIIKAEGAVFHDFSYMGGFPLFWKDGTQLYSIQGMVKGLGIVCSIPKDELVTIAD